MTSISLVSSLAPARCADDARATRVARLVWREAATLVGVAIAMVLAVFL